MAREQLQSLTEPMFYVLLVLTRPMHGYEIMQTIKEISRDAVTVGAGTLYALLTRFEKEGAVRLTHDDGRRKVYKITEKGRELLDREYSRLKETIAVYNNYISQTEGEEGGTL